MNFKLRVKGHNQMTHKRENITNLWRLGATSIPEGAPSECSLIINTRKRSTGYIKFKARNSDCIEYLYMKFIRVNSPNFGRLPNTEYRPLYTMMSQFAAFGRITN